MITYDHLRIIKKCTLVSYDSWQLIAVSNILNVAGTKAVWIDKSWIMNTLEVIFSSYNCG